MKDILHSKGPHDLYRSYSCYNSENNGFKNWAYSSDGEDMKCI